jgi:hypothetical protein
MAIITTGMANLLIVLAIGIAAGLVFYRYGQTWLRRQFVTRHTDVTARLSASLGRSLASCGSALYALTPIGIQARPAAQALRCSATLRNSGLEQRKTHTVEGSRLRSKLECTPAGGQVRS